MHRRALTPKIVLFLTGILLLTGLRGCDAPCDNLVIKQSLSPDRRYSAVVFRRNCGAATDYSTQISLLDPDATPTGGGNVFVADDTYGTASLSMMSGPWAAVEWLGPRHLLVQYASGARIFVQEEKVEDVKITFKAAN